MLAELGNDLKNLLLAGVGAVAVTAEKSEELLKELVKRGELTVEQGKVLNEELKHRIQEKKQPVKQGEPLAAQWCSAPSVEVERMSREERAQLLKKLQELDAKEQDGNDKAVE